VSAIAKSATTNRGGSPKGVIRGGRNGSQPVYSQALAEEILDRTADGESLRSICSDPRMPSHSIVLKWVQKNVGVSDSGGDGFGDQYARAKSAALEVMAEDIIEIGDADIMVNGVPDNALVQRARLMCDNRKWMLSKLLPRQFGDKVTQELTGDPDRPLVTMIQLVPVAPKRLPKPDDDE
jgi:hypothetical protein